MQNVLAFIQMLCIEYKRHVINKPTITGISNGSVTYERCTTVKVHEFQLNTCSNGKSIQYA